jgi:hypothetical protein
MSGTGNRHLFMVKTGFIVSIIFILVTFNTYTQEKQAKAPDQSYWRALRSFPDILSLKFYDQNPKMTLDISTRGQVEDPSGQRVKSFKLKMKPIKRVLEKCKVGEAVSLNIYTQTGKFIVNLGTFYPKIQKKNQVSFKILDNIKHSMSFLQFRHLILEYILNKKDFADPVQCKMQFKNHANLTKAELKVNCYFYIQNNSVMKPFINLLSNELIGELEAFCNKITGLDQRICFYIMADYFFFRKNYDKAGYYYDLVKEKSKLKEIGDIYLQRRQYEKFIAYYEKLDPSPAIAEHFGKLGDFFKKEKKISLAKTCYKKAIHHLKCLLRSFLYPWDDKYFKDLRYYIQSKNQLPRSPKEEEQHQKKLKILKNSAQYCKKVKDSSFLFFCTEDITDIRRGDKNRFVYDYQLVKEGQEIKESKKQLNEGPGRNFPGVSYENKYIIFGPNGLIGFYWQDYHDYEMLEEEIIEGEKFYIIEAIPIFPLKINNLFGKLWIDSKDYSILKIQWYGKSLSNSKEIWDYATKRGLIPSITFYTEFNISKNGIRFPTKHYLEEAFIRKKNKKNIRAKTIVLYKDYHFFYVETDVVKIETPEKNQDH